MQKITVIIPTYKHKNRIEDLLDLIRSLIIESNSKYIHEVLVVDNGISLDKEAKYFELLSCKKIKIINEPCVGLNCARNTGVANAANEIVAFLDDDVVVVPSWAESIAFGHCDDEILCVGGPVIIRNQKLRYPHWFSDYFLRFLLPPSFPAASGLLKFPYFLIGANMSFKKKAFITYGLFNPDLDRKGKNLLSCGDIEFIIRIPQGLIKYEAQAVVIEKIKENRLTRYFSIRRIFWQGISDAIMVKNRGVDRFYDKKEIFFTSYFIKEWISTIIRGNFFEAFCRVIRLFSYKYETIVLSFKKAR